MVRSAFWMLLTCIGATHARGQDVSTFLTDKIFQGSGTINLLKDVSPDTLNKYLQASSTPLLGVDVNENASGNETSTSMGVAIKSMTLHLTTSTGDFSFSNVFTNTSSIIADKTGVSGSYYTLFGKAGSSQINSSVTGFNMAALDDVVELKNVSFTGTILSANLDVSFLSTNAKGGTNETFFDFSGGFEDFALLSRAAAVSLESAAIGTADAPSAVSYATAPISETVLAPVTTTTTTAVPTVTDSTAPISETILAPVLTTASTGSTTVTSDPGVSSAPAAPGAPLPPVWFFAAATLLMLLRKRMPRIAIT